MGKHQGGTLSPDSSVSAFMHAAGESEMIGSPVGAQSGVDFVVSENPMSHSGWQALNTLKIQVGGWVYVEARDMLNMLNNAAVALPALSFPIAIMDGIVLCVTSPMRRV